MSRINEGAMTPEEAQVKYDRLVAERLQRQQALWVARNAELDVLWAEYRPHLKKLTRIIRKGRAEEVSG